MFWLLPRLAAKISLAASAYSNFEYSWPIGVSKLTNGAWDYHGCHRARFAGGRT